MTNVECVVDETLQADIAGCDDDELDTVQSRGGRHAQLAKDC